MGPGVLARYTGTAEDSGRWAVAALAQRHVRPQLCAPQPAPALLPLAPAPRPTRRGCCTWLTLFGFRHLRRHGEQLYLSDLSKSVAVYTAPVAAEAPATAAVVAKPRAQPRVAPPLRPQVDAARETTSPPIDPLSAPAAQASPVSAGAAEQEAAERRRDRKLAAPMRKMGGGPPPMAAPTPAAAGGAADWEMDM